MEEKEVEEKKEEEEEEEEKEEEEEEEKEEDSLTNLIARQPACLVTRSLRPGSYVAYLPCQIQFN